MKANRIAVVLMIGAGLSTPVMAQFTQYTPPGGVDQLELSDIKAELDEAIHNSKWRLGKLFLDPWISLKDLGYDDNVGNRPADSEQISDYTATLGLGLRAYVPGGARTTVAFHALPEYVWWNRVSERGRLKGRYGVGLFSGGARFNTALSATRSDGTQLFSNEFEDRVNVTDERGSGSLDFALGRGFALFSLATLVRLEYDGQDDNAPNLAGANREERVARLGLRRRLQSGLSIGLGLEASEVEFVEPNSPRNNKGEAPFLQLVLDREVFFGNVFIAQRDLEFEDSLLTFDRQTGRFFFAWRPVEAVELQTFGSRSLVYSFSDAYAYFENSHAGVGLLWKIDPRFAARVYTEEGSNDYTPFDLQTEERLEDLRSIGATLEITLGKVTTIINASRTEYDSTIPSLDRTINTIAINLTVGSKGESPWS